MHFLYIALIGAAVLFILIGIFKNSDKEVSPKPKQREKAVLDKNIEKENVPAVQQPVENKSVPTIKNVLPSKEIRLEISRFREFSDKENENLVEIIKNGIHKTYSQNFKSALEDFSHAIEIKPSEPTGHYCRALTKLALKNYESAISDFTESIRLQMKQPNILYYRGLANFGAKDFDHAIQDFTNYLKAESKFADAYFNLALCYKHKSDFKNAIKYFSDSILKNPRNETAFFERGLLKNKIDDRNGCCNDLKTAMSMGHLESYHYIKEFCVKEELKTLA